MVARVGCAGADALYRRGWRQGGGAEKGRNPRNGKKQVPTFSEKLVEEYPQSGELSDDVDVNYQYSLSS